MATDKLPGPKQLAELGIEDLSIPGRVYLRCKTCGQEWSPNLIEGGRLPSGWWHCPKGCNWPMGR